MALRKGDDVSIKDKLISALTQYDQRQSTRKFYNPHALGIYFERVDDVMRDIERGATPRQALLAGFNDRLLDVCLKAIGEKPFTKEEMYSQSVVYTPAKQ